MPSNFIIVLVPVGTRDMVGEVGTLLNQYVLPLDGLKLDEWPMDKAAIDEWWIGMTPFDGCVRGILAAERADLEAIKRGHKLDGNVIPVSEVPQSLDVAAVVTPDGQWHHHDQSGHSLMFLSVDDQEPGWRSRRNAILAQNRDCLVVGVKVES